MRSLASYLRSLDPGLSRAVWTLQLGSFANAFGNGVVWPFLLIYLHNVRGFGLGTAGIALAVMNVTAVVAGPPVGSLLDHVGARTGASAARARRRRLLAGAARPRLPRFPRPRRVPDRGRFRLAAGPASCVRQEPQRGRGARDRADLPREHARDRDLPAADREAP